MPKRLISSQSNYFSFACLGIITIFSLIGCQQPISNATGPSGQVSITGPNTPAAVDLALQDQPAVAVPTAGQTNLLRNSSFENFTGNTPDDWVACAPDVLQASSDVTDGSNAVLIAQNRSCLFQSAQITPGQNLNLTCQAKLVQNLGWTGWGLTFYDASFRKIGGAPTRRITSLNYEQYDTSATAPESAKYATVWAYSEGQVLLDQCNLGVTDPSSIGNLLVNGGFEGNLTNWTLCGEATQVGISTLAQSGARAMRLSQKGCAYQDTVLKPNHEYEFTCNAKVAGRRWTEMSLISMDANWQVLTRQGIPVINDVYGSYSVVMVTPPEMVRSAVALYSESDEALFDGCTLKDTGLEIDGEPGTN
jgi:Carbohydrate binding domain